MIANQVYEPFPTVYHSVCQQDTGGKSNTWSQDTQHGIQVSPVVVQQWFSVKETLLKIQPEITENEDPLYYPSQSTQPVIVMFFKYCPTKSESGGPLRELQKLWSKLDVKHKRSSAVQNVDKTRGWPSPGSVTHVQIPNPTEETLLGVGGCATTCVLTDQRVLFIFKMREIETEVLSTASPPKCTIGRL